MKWSRKYQGVTAFVGMPGSGKTYGLAQVAKRAMDRGEVVYSNAGFEVAGTRVLHDWEEFVAIPTESEDGCVKRERSEGCEHGALWLPTTIVWDELPLYFNARKWSEFPDGMLYALTQIRKDGRKLYYSSIDEMMIDTTIRRVTFWYWHCRAVSSRLLRRSLWPPESFRKARQRPFSREWVRVRDDVAALYDTTRKVELPERVRARYMGDVATNGSPSRSEGRRASRRGPEGDTGTRPESVAPGGSEAAERALSG